MSELYRFDVDYLDEERGIKHIPCDDGDYVLAEDALALQATITELQADVKRYREETSGLAKRYRLDAHSYQRSHTAYCQKKGNVAVGRTSTRYLMELSNNHALQLEAILKAEPPEKGDE